MTIKDLTKEIGVSRQTLNNWERFCNVNRDIPETPKFPKSILISGTRVFDENSIFELKELQQHIYNMSRGKSMRNDRGIRGIIRSGRIN